MALEVHNSYVSLPSLQEIIASALTLFSLHYDGNGFDLLEIREKGMILKAAGVLTVRFLSISGSCEIVAIHQLVLEKERGMERGKEQGMYR